MRLPEVQARLREIADTTGIQELHDLAAAISRRKPVKKARRSAQPVTEGLLLAIRAYAAAYPHLPNREIGKVFDVDGGRVSEALAGKKT